MSTASRPTRLPADLAPLADWVRERGWKPFPFQATVWREAADGRSGLLHAPTGTGKTLAAWLGALARSRRGAVARGAGSAPLAGVVARRLARRGVDPLLEDHVVVAAEEP